MRKLVYSCHQPNFIPWIGYFHKILRSDYFVILDDVQYTKNSVANRNKLRNAQDFQMMTIPIRKKVAGTSFFSYNDAEIADKNWYMKFFKSLDQNYKKAKFYENYRENLFKIFAMNNFCQLNIAFIKFIIEELQINTKILLMSKLDNLSGKNNDLIINIGKTIGAKSYLSGAGAKKYNDQSMFDDAGIWLTYQKFAHPRYTQISDPFIEGLSILDLLLNEGKNSLNIINKI